MLSPGWDDEDGPSIDRSAIHQASKFATGLSVPWLPTASPTLDGGVRIEWDAGTAFLIIDFVDEHSREVYFRGSEKDEVSAWIDDEVPQSLSFEYMQVFQAHLRAT